MDLTVDFPELAALRKEATGIRASYNLKRGLGEGELSGPAKDSILASLHALLANVEAAAPQLPPETAAPAQAVVACAGLEKHFRNAGHQFTLGPVDLELRSGEITGVVGENGNGKTTLLRIIAGELQADAGNPKYPGLGLETPTGYQVRQRIAFIPQRLMPWTGTLLQNLKFSAAIHGLKGTANTNRADFVIHRLGLTRFQHLKWKQLSSGYKLRFELARMVVWNPGVLVLDEPIANLDLIAQQLFLQDLAHLAASTAYPLGVILSSQQLHQIEEVADQMVFLRNGKPLYTGSMTGFGTQRATNAFELSGSFTAEALGSALSAVEGIRVDENGLSFTVFTPLHIGGRDLLTLLLDSGLEVTYFRNISGSTRMLLSNSI